MVYNSQDTARTPGGLAHAAATFFESVGLLNKGSADAKAVPDDAEAAKIQPIMSNSLNVTRVGGLASLVTSVGAVALAIFNVNKKTDPANVVMAAYLAAGAIVVAALLTAAIIVSADIRARTSVAVTHSPDTPAPIAAPPATPAQNHQPTTSPAPGTSIPPAVLVPPSPDPPSPVLPSPVLPSPVPSSPVPPAAGTQASAGPSVTDHATATVQGPRSWQMNLCPRQALYRSCGRSSIQIHRRRQSNATLSCNLT